MKQNFESKAASKLIVKACRRVDQHRAVLTAPEDQKARAMGRLRRSDDELAEAVEKYRKCGGQP